MSQDGGRITHPCGEVRTRIMPKLTADLQPAQDALAAGFHLVPLHHNSKRPIGDAWNSPDNWVEEIDLNATGYGLPLAINGLCSIDPDHVAARKGFKAWGFNLDVLMNLGVRTESTRKNSGGRSTFLVPDGLRWLSFAGYTEDGRAITLLELRATSPNLQDVIPGLVYEDRRGELCTQSYSNGKTLKDADVLPEKFAEFWHRMSNDRQFFLEQYQLFVEAIGLDYRQPMTEGTGEELAYPAPGIRSVFNAEHSVEDILQAHGYHHDTDTDRWAHPDATGLPGIRLIPDKQDLWASSHAGDPLKGVFDAWAANVQLNHEGDVDSAIAAQRTTPQQDFAEFREDPVAVAKEEAERAAKAAFNFTHISELIATPPKWLIPDLLEERSIAIWFGEPGSYKTFLVVDAALRVAAGMDYHGLGECSQGAVVYLAGEGHGGFARRIEAWASYNAIDKDTLPFYKSDRAGTFGDGETRKQMLDGIRIAFQRAVEVEAKLFVVDTLARNLGGDENSSTDINAMFELLNTLQGYYPDLAVLIVAHPGLQDKYRPRGSSALMGNTDAYAKIEAIDNLSCRLRSYKMKDAPNFPDVYFDMQVVDIEGEAMGSLVPISGAAPQMDFAATPEENLQEALRVLLENDVRNVAQWEALAPVKQGRLKQYKLDGLVEKVGGRIRPTTAGMDKM